MIKPVAIIISLSLALTSVSVRAESIAPEYLDSVVTLRDVSVTAQKMGAVSTGAVTSIDASQIQRYNVNSLKRASTIAPNFFIPEYGSQMTSTIYMRGLGSRIDQAAVGVNIDNMPVMNKETFDFELVDIDRIEIVRGPQSLMYGRNTMGGIINIHTLSPLSYQGLRASAELSSGISERGSLGYYGRITPKLAMSGTAAVASCDGFWHNNYNGAKVGRTFETRGRWRTVWTPTSAVTLDNVATADYARQSGYPYVALQTGQIASNDTCYYHRTTFTDALTATGRIGDMQHSSVTSFQYVNDNVTLDQDFTPDDYFTLTQRRHEWTVTQDFTLSGKHGVYGWLAGLSGFYRRTAMTAPVTFMSQGIDEIILGNIPPQAPIKWGEETLGLASVMAQRNRSVAVYHQSTVSLGKWELAIGLRYDVEQARLDYTSYTHTSFLVETPRVTLREPLDVTLSDRLQQTFREFSPKLTVSYTLPGAVGNTVYATVSRGYKAGGYNTQMFSDILKQEMMVQMMQKYMPGGAGMVVYNPDEIMSYRPERSMNYEMGINGATDDGVISGSLTLFHMELRDQQLTAFPPGTLTGRIMTNAGRTRSSGIEATMTVRPLNGLVLSASYGLTDARFRRYNNGEEQLDGKRLPYAPRHTLFGSATWSHSTGHKCLSAIDLSANVRGIGPIYWDDSNSVRQNFYALLGASVTAHFGAQRRLSATLWGENLTATQYNTFYFVSVKKQFLQRGRPRTFGLTLRYNI